jgi:ribosomal-protein-alanine N-acetyltransferase
MESIKSFPNLETGNLFLRELTQKDVEFYFQHFNKPEIVIGTCFPGPATIDIARREFERFIRGPWVNNTGLRWGIMVKDEMKLVGTCGYYDWVHDAMRAEVGYDLDPFYWGKGIMTEALTSVIKYGLEAMNLNRVQALIDSYNERSMRLVERLGFKKEGVLRQRSIFKGEFRDDVCFSLLKRDWYKR